MSEEVVPLKKGKVTEFEGFLSGDCECFCLSKVPFKELVRVTLKGSIPVYYPDALLLYPCDFFPKDCKNGKWKFKITVEATKVGKRIQN